MTNPLAITKYICKKSNWEIPNLDLQRILYISQMFHLGKEKTPLLYGGFQASYYGPISPNSYHKCKIFGAEPVDDIFYWGIQDNLEDYDINLNLLNQVINILFKKESWELVAITHWNKGAWYKNYRPGGGIPIPDKDIIEEYKNRYNNI